MCQNAAKTAASLLTAIEPTLKSLLAATGQLTTDAGKSAIAAYDAALAALETWQPGTVADTVLQVVAAFQAAFQTVAGLIPPPYGTLVNIILAGIEAVLGVIKANSPAPAAPAGTSAHAETQAMFQAHVVAETSERVQALVPHFKRSIWHSPQYQYTKTWNDAVTAAGLPQTMHVA
jgi:hypothetical protein